MEQLEKVDAELRKQEMKAQSDSMALLASAIAGRHVPQAEAPYKQHRQQSYYHADIQKL